MFSRNRSCKSRIVRLPMELFNFSADYLGYSKQRTEEICVMNSIRWCITKMWVGFFLPQGNYTVRYITMLFTFNIYRANTQMIERYDPRQPFHCKSPPLKSTGTTLKNVSAIYFRYNKGKLMDFLSKVPVFSRIRHLLR